MKGDVWSHPPYQDMNTKGGGVTSSTELFLLTTPGCIQHNAPALQAYACTHVYVHALMFFHKCHYAVSLLTDHENIQGFAAPGKGTARPSMLPCIMPLHEKIQTYVKNYKHAILKRTRTVHQTVHSVVSAQLALHPGFAMWIVAVTVWTKPLSSVRTKSVAN